MLKPMSGDYSNAAAYGGSHIAGGSIVESIRDDAQVITDLSYTESTVQIVASTSNFQL